MQVRNDAALLIYARFKRRAINAVRETVLMHAICRSVAVAVTVSKFFGDKQIKTGVLCRIM